MIFKNQMPHGISS